MFALCVQPLTIGSAGTVIPLAPLPSVTATPVPLTSACLPPKDRRASWIVEKRGRARISDARVRVRRRRGWNFILKERELAWMVVGKLDVVSGEW
jgi:hypothetical protein